MLVFSKVLFPLKILRLTVTFLGGRALPAAGPSLNITLPTLASFLWYARRASDLTLTASLICFGRSLVILGSMAPTQPPPTSSKAAQPERSTGRCRSKATGRATVLFFLFQLLGLSSAETLDPPELPASPSSVSVWAVLLIIGLLLFGEACCLYDVLPYHSDFIFPACPSASTPLHLYPLWHCLHATLFLSAAAQVCLLCLCVQVSHLG